MVGEDRCLRHTALRLPTFTSDPDLGQVSTRPSLVYIQLTPLFRAVGGSVMSECVPVDVSDVTRSTGANEANRYHGTLLLVTIDKLTAGQRLPVHQQAGARPRASLLFKVLRDEPLWELKCCDSPSRCGWVIISRRGVLRSTAGTSSTAASFRLSRGSEIDSPPAVQKSNPAMSTEWFGRSTIEPGPNVVTSWLCRISPEGVGLGLISRLPEGQHCRGSSPRYSLPAPRHAVIDLP